MGIRTGIILAALLTLASGCVSEKAFDEVMQQLEKERTKTEMEREKNQTLSEDLESIQEKLAGLGKSGQPSKEWVKARKAKEAKLLAQIKNQSKKIKSLTKNNIIKPNMSWAKSTATRLQRALKSEVRNGSAKVKLTEDRLMIILSDLLLFEEDGVGITLDGEDLLARLGEVLKNVKGHEIVIGGHLDNTPIAPVMVPEFPTVWEFTGARAVEVLRFLEEENKISPKLLSAAAYGLSRPVSSNKDEAGRARNRRVEITLLP